MVILQNGAHLSAVCREIFMKEMLQCLEYAFVCFSSVEWKKKVKDETRIQIIVIEEVKLRVNLVLIILFSRILYIIENFHSKMFKIKT